MRTGEELKNEGVPKYEMVGFKMEVSSPWLALHAVRRRIYLMCRRHADGRLTYGNKRVDYHGREPNFELVRQVAGPLGSIFSPIRPFF